MMTSVPLVGRDTAIHGLSGDANAHILLDGPARV